MQGSPHKLWLSIRLKTEVTPSLSRCKGQRQVPLHGRTETGCEVGPNLKSPEHGSGVYVWWGWGVGEGRGGE